MTDQRNMILAVVLTILIFLAYEYFIGQPQMEAQLAAQDAAQALEQQAEEDAANTGINAPAAVGSPTVNTVDGPSDVPRITISSPRLEGSLSLAGGRIDDLQLADYHVDVDESSPSVRLLSPTGTQAPYFAEFGWVAPPGTDVTLPDATAIWQASGRRLAPGQPVTLTWQSDDGLTFTRTFSLDENYMFTVTQNVQNDSTADIQLAPFGRIARHGTPEVSGFYILHEGPVGILGGVLEEVDYEDIREDGTVLYDSQGGWLGITDKYWLTALVPGQDDHFEAGVRYNLVSNRDRYQVDVRYDTQVIPAGSDFSITSRFFAGAKEVNLIEAYAEQLGIDKFDRSIDWGWFHFLTQPIFHALDFFKNMLGNFGLAILALTVVMKLLFFPLANKSYVSMSKMKKLQPKVKELQEKYGDDKAQQQQEMMKLYREEKVNPVSGCLPMLIQIPVFFCLYKVLFVTIEMRHAPFYGWVNDLSAPDTALILTGFGMFPWDVPSFLALGVWPVLMGISMFLQQRLNPQAADPVQAKLFMLMPIFFTFLMGRFPVGLVIYWTWNNLLSMSQQWFIMKRVERKG